MAFVEQKPSRFTKKKSHPCLLIGSDDSNILDFGGIGVFPTEYLLKHSIQRLIVLNQRFVLDAMPAKPSDSLMLQHVTQTVNPSFGLISKKGCLLQADNQNVTIFHITRKDIFMLPPKEIFKIPEVVEQLRKTTESILNRNKKGCRCTVCGHNTFYDTGEIHREQRFMHQQAGTNWATQEPIPEKKIPMSTRAWFLYACKNEKCSKFNVKVPQHKHPIPPLS